MHGDEAEPSFELFTSDAEESVKLCSMTGSVFLPGSPTLSMELETGQAAPSCVGGVGGQGSGWAYACST
jgi:hypothetical protein